MKKYKILKLITILISLLSLCLNCINTFKTQAAGMVNNENGLIITEFASFGTKDSQNNCKQSIEVKFNCSLDKWIEFYNNSNSEIDMSNYEFYFGNGKVESYFGKINLQGAIKPGVIMLIKNKNISIKSTLQSFVNVQEYGLLQNISKKINETTVSFRFALKNKINSNLNISFDSEQFCNKSDISTLDLNFNTKKFVCSEDKWNINNSDMMYASPGALSTMQLEAIKPEMKSEVKSELKQTIILPESVDQQIKPFVEIIPEINQKAEINLESTLLKPLVDTIMSDQKYAQKDRLIQNKIEKTQNSASQSISVSSPALNMQSNIITNTAINSLNNMPEIKIPPSQYIDKKTEQKLIQAKPVSIDVNSVLFNSGNKMGFANSNIFTSNNILKLLILFIIAFLFDNRLIRAFKFIVTSNKILTSVKNNFCKI